MNPYDEYYGGQIEMENHDEEMYGGANAEAYGQQDAEPY
jgi:hypothetical protein